MRRALLKDFWVIRFLSLSSRLVGALLMGPVAALVELPVAVLVEPVAALLMALVGPGPALVESKVLVLVAEARVDAPDV